ncbi:EAL domain-containing protein [Coralliovum pocilloporae]|uniref:EAL domain-containing protein n=1 Tax=Coralliovum pocilloporae TaxID=3066369 RepID=UPI0033072FC4
MLNMHSEDRLTADIRAAAQLMLSRAEAAIASSVSAVDTMQKRNISSCSVSDRYHMSRLVAAEPWLDQIGIVDRGGTLRCMHNRPKHVINGFLPAHDRNARKIQLALLEEPIRGTRSLVVAVHIGKGVRAIARIRQEAIQIDPVANEIRADRASALVLSDSSVWYGHGEYELLKLPDGRLDTYIVVTERSEKFPIQARIAVHEYIVAKVDTTLRTWVKVGGAFLGLLVFAVTLGILWRFDQASQMSIKTAILNGEFVPFYQPIVDLSSGEIVGAEVLTRWMRRGEVVLPPSEFIPLAASQGHIDDLELAIWDRVVDDMGAFYKERSDLKLALNIYGGRFSSVELTSDLEEHFGSTAIALNQLIVEVNERRAIDDIQTARIVIDSIRQLGIQVALDDVGSGHGGLAVLNQVSVDIVKLDKVLVDVLGSKSVSVTVIKSLIDMAGSLGIGIIAEGLETQEQLVALRSLGVSTAQGYLFSGIVAADDFKELANHSAAAKGEGAEETLDDAEAEETADAA